MALLRTTHFILLALLCLFVGCSSGSSGGDEDADADTNASDATPTWNKIKVGSVDGGGMLIPNIMAAPGKNNDVHMVSFNESSEEDLNYVVNYRVLDAADFSERQNSSLIEIDNCRTIGFALDSESAPVVSYQGGEIRECGSEQQSDAMFSIMEGSGWSEYTGGIGYVERNPVFQDGLSGTTVSVAVDSEGAIHMCYQFFYEGCDAMNFNFPDLLYVKKEAGAFADESIEEVVCGNIYNPNGTASEQNNVGDHVQILIDKNDTPFVFYYADLSPVMPDDDQKGLRVSRKIDSTWEHSFIETGIEVADISCALDGEGNPAVAYYIENEYEDSRGTHKKCLKYAVQKEGVWEIHMVDESVLCGKYCSLAFDQSGSPSIAYYALENHSGSREMKDLKFANYRGAEWQVETVSEEGDIGKYNSLWFDSHNDAHICSYSNSKKEIYIFVKE